MNIEKVTYKLISDTVERGEISPFIVKMMISYLTDEERGAVIDEIINELPSIEFKKGDAIWFDTKDNKYDLKDCYEDDMMKDNLRMDEYGHIRGIIVDDCNYQDGCNPYATEYKIAVHFDTPKNSKLPNFKEIRVKRSNIKGLWKPLE
tara:strand:+ start:1100 stop:1543 length:444 start_codon:yes stop_codon:yes gene_type:complete